MRLKIGIGALLLIFVSSLAIAEAASDIRATLFKDAVQALTEANAVKASIYAPVSYSDGAEKYREAESILSSGGAIESLQRSLTEATRHFRKSVSATEVAQVSLVDAIAARSDAQSAEASKFASEIWTEAEKEFANAVQRLEQGSLKSAQRIGEDAREMYREAELLAIKANYLDETRLLLEQAKEAKAKRYAPITLKKAQALLKDAEQALDQDRYDTDRPRSLAQDAKYEARHAIYLAKMGKQLRDRKVTSEEAILDWESAVRSIAVQLDSVVDFADGPNVATEPLTRSIQELQNARSLSDSVAMDRDAQINALNQQITSLESQLGGEERSLERVNALLAEQDRIRARIQQVEKMFTEDEAVVLRKGNDVIIRMVGLNFDTGEAVIKTDHYALLGTLREAFELFPNSPIVIEGHTDAFGSDEFNYNLSEQRANAVSEYMKSVAGFNPGRLLAVGYGETRPAANNETAEGRTRNRRIDVVISKAGELAQDGVSSTNR